MMKEILTEFSGLAHSKDIGSAHSYEKVRTWLLRQ